MKPFQSELPVVGPVYNLSVQQAPDMNDRSNWRRKITTAIESCPGFIGADIPQTVNSPGKVVIEPGLVVDAMKFLKRRFQVAENLDLSRSGGLCIDIRPRNRRSGVKRQKFLGKRGEQFEFSL
jgi:hypothetical protein